ncbi:MAG: hypothetical protein AAF546_09390 [Verrucomicrobiota bacterium]
MKPPYYYIALVFILCSICLGDEQTLDLKEWKKPAIEALHQRKEMLLRFERTIAEEKYGKEKAQIYMKYFEMGMASETGSIMIEGQQGRWLEIGHWRGFSFREVFIAGYSAASTSK